MVVVDIAAHTAAEGDQAAGHNTEVAVGIGADMVVVGTGVRTVVVSEEYCRIALEAGTRPVEFPEGAGVVSIGVPDPFVPCPGAEFQCVGPDDLIRLRYLPNYSLFHVLNHSFFGKTENLFNLFYSSDRVKGYIIM